MLLPTNLGGVTTYYSLTATDGRYITSTATTPFPTNAKTTSTSSSSSATSLSTAAKIGIGAGIGAAVLITAALAAFILMKRRRRSKRQPSVAPAPGSNFGEQTLDESHWSPKAELASDAQTQRFSKPMPQELSTNHSNQDLSLPGEKGVGSDRSGIHELPDTNLAGYTHAL